MSKRKPRYYRHCFPSQIISHSVFLYHRFSLSFRYVEDLLAERGVIVSYERIRNVVTGYVCLKHGPDRTLPRRGS